MSCKSESIQVVSIPMLNQSVCRSVFPHWSVNKLRNNDNSVRNVSVSGCGNFSKADEDLNALLRSVPPSVN